MGETWYLPRCPLSNSPQACPAASASRQPGQSLAAPSPASVTVSGPDKTASCDAPRCESTLNPVCPTTEPLIMHTQPPDQKVPLEMKQKSHHTTMNYSAYGLHTDCGSAAPALAYNGEHHDPFSRLYLLGNGHRPYSSRLMRFNTSDSQSPFLLGGLNSYCYCNGDPINFSDPSGQMRTPLRPVNTPNVAMEAIPLSANPRVCVSVRDPSGPKLDKPVRTQDEKLEKPKPQQSARHIPGRR
ncbi:RHS repeat-associated core domain-containing protein [Pseudomonas shirazica]|nr:RHS repeat-associated core domain-containing protein [Pseudomonas shirazica]